MTHLTIDEFRKRTKKTPVKRTKKPAPMLRMDEMRELWYQAGVEKSDRGICMHRFFLPIQLCQRQDARLKVVGWKAAKMKRDVTGYLRMQCAPLTNHMPGRPLVRCIRFSSVEPDKYSDWAKLAIDCLCAPNKRSPNRLNIIKDDAPKYAEIEQVWRKAKPGQGFVVIEILSGEP